MIWIKHLAEVVKTGMRKVREFIKQQAAKNKQSANESHPTGELISYSRKELEKKTDLLSKSSEDKGYKKDEPSDQAELEESEKETEQEDIYEAEKSYSSNDSHYYSNDHGDGYNGPVYLPPELPKRGNTPSKSKDKGMSL